MTTKSKTSSPSKSAAVHKLLQRDKGATIAEIAKATGWKDHSCRAFLTGVRKRATVLKEQRGDGQTAYRLEKAPKSAAVAANGAPELPA